MDHYDASSVVPILSRLSHFWLPRTDVADLLHAIQFDLGSNTLLVPGSVCVSPARAPGPGVSIETTMSTGGSTGVWRLKPRRRTPVRCFGVRQKRSESINSSEVIDVSKMSLSTVSSECRIVGMIGMSDNVSADIASFWGHHCQHQVKWFGCVVVRHLRSHCVWDATRVVLRRTASELLTTSENFFCWI